MFVIESCFKILDLMEGRLFYTLHGHQVLFKWYVASASDILKYESHE